MKYLKYNEMEEKERYLKAVEKWGKLEKEIRKQKDIIGKTFVYLLESERPLTFEKLEKFIGQKIKKIACVKYACRHCPEWANVLIIKAGEGKEESKWDVKTLVISTSEYFDRDGYDEFIYTEDLEYKDGYSTIDDIASEIYRAYPEAETEEL